MAILSINVPDTMAIELDQIDWIALKYKNKREWIREMLRKEVPKIKPKTKIGENIKCQKI